jgi:hypothetical protein
MMKYLLVAILTLASQQAPSQSKAVLEGRILHAGSTAPIPNVQVTLVGQAAAGTVTPDLAARIQSLTDSGNQLGVGQAAIDNAIANLQANSPGSQTSVLTDISGRFTFRDLAPGRYTIRATGEGFFGPPVNGTSPTQISKVITIEAQKPVTPVELFMVKGAVISGRIRDPNGQPVSGVTIAATRVTYTNGRAQWTTVSSKATDDRGEYRIFWVAPGNYNVGTLARTISSIPNPQDSWARTFFPGVSDTSSATVLNVKDGEDLTGIDFTIQTLPQNTLFKISGRAINPFAVPNTNTGAVDRGLSSFMLAPREPGILDSPNPPSVQNALPVQSRPNGEFEIRNVHQGSYDLIAYFQPLVAAPVPSPPPAAPPLPGVPPPPPPPPPVRRYDIARARVEVRNSDVEGVQLTIQKGSDVRGQVTNQSATPIALEKLRINFRSQDVIPETFVTIIGSIPVDSTGSFSVQDVLAARVSLQVTGLPDTAYVADIRLGGVSVIDSGLIFDNQPMTNLEILVNGSGGAVEGMVQNSDRKPAANATVALVPSETHRLNPMMFKNVQSDEMGHFLVKGLAPGDYTIYAWESVLPTAWMNAEFLAKYQGRGHAIRATSGSRSDTQLDLIPDETIRR